MRRSMTVATLLGLAACSGAPRERTRVQLTPFMFESAIVVERQEAVP